MTIRDLIARWLVASIVIDVVAFTFMFVWLWRRGARPSLFLMNTPTHLIRVHRRWCAEQGRRPGWIGWLMPLVVANLYASLAAFFLFFFLSP